MAACGPEREDLLPLGLAGTLLDRGGGLVLDVRGGPSRSAGGAAAGTEGAEEPSHPGHPTTPGGVPGVLVVGVVGVPAAVGVDRGTGREAAASTLVTWYADGGAVAESAGGADAVTGSAWGRARGRDAWGLAFCLLGRFPEMQV